MINDGEKWHHLALKNLSFLLKGITSNHKGDFYWLNCFQSYKNNINFKKMKMYIKNHDYCYVEMPREDYKILKYKHGKIWKYMKVPFIIYDMEFLFEKLSTCHNNPKRSWTTKINKHAPSGYSLFTHWSVDATKNRLDCYRGKEYMKKFCKDLKEHTKKIINYE